jgi:hypothetical protein
MLCDGKMQCLECPLNSTCASSTRVFINYCGSMPNSLKEQIYHARVECRKNRRYFKYRGIQKSLSGITSTLVFPSDSEVLSAHGQF